ncbi:MAG: hypothetical protein RDV41_06165, partial [Planctomycetota bacterium]|nr:hypothetical protein [Planctomycetota bacterium]
MRHASCRGGVMAKVLGCLGGLIALGVAIIVLVWVLTDAPAKVARAFLDATGKGDAAKAYEYCSAEFKGNVPLSELTELMKLNPHLFNVKESTFSERHIESGGTSTLGGTVTAQ